jgi:hypothetical protein
MTAALPKSVQAQLEHADAIEAQIQREVSGEASPAAQAPAADPPTAPAVEPAAPATPAEPAQPVAQQPAQEPQSAPAANEWEAKYKVLEGKYRSEVPRLAQQVRESNQLVAQILRERQQQPQPSAQPAPEQPLVSQNDAEEFGADLMTAVARVAGEVAGRAVAQAMEDFRKEIGAVQGQVKTVSDRVEKSAEEQFWDRVRGLVPSWDQIDADPQWAAFLDGAPEFSTLTYRELAGAAFQSGSAEKIAKIVETWRGQSTSARPAQPQAPAQPAQSRPNLSHQQAPTTSKAAVPTQPAAKIWTRAEYEQVYDHRWARQVGPKEAAEQQALADQAVQEGRVNFA